jgi:hypothetical protein
MAMNYLQDIFSDNIRQWNNRCPVCGACVTFRLHNGEAGSTSIARCGNNIKSTRDFSKDKSDRQDMKLCDWKGKAVRMTDGSVRFKDRNGRFLIEW